MTNKEAIEIIRKEILCVDRDCDIERSCGNCDLVKPSKEPILEAYKMAIAALSVQKTGFWKKIQPYPLQMHEYECSECLHEVDDCTENYCSECGAHMLGVHD